MQYPFPGMDPYLEQRTLWAGVHARLTVAIANQLQPRLDPRYIAAVEERVFLEGQQRLTSDAEIQEVREARVEILDSANDMRLVALIEVVSPTNKIAGPGRVSYRAKQKETLARDCHLVEIDLLRRGRHVLAIQKWRLRGLGRFDSLCCVSRWPRRNRFELDARTLRQRLPRLNIPLAEGDSDVMLDVQAALEQVYVGGRYAQRIRYDEKFRPRLPAEDQAWADERIAAFRAAREESSPGGGE